MVSNYIEFFFLGVKILFCFDYRCYNEEGDKLDDSFCETGQIGHERGEDLESRSRSRILEERCDVLTSERP